ncbi:MAG: patatin-like phospholipase family protein [Rhodobacteraceae bacterium]|nr:patatin-like phospholipase family protein [Paracoccaceae bacterium]
MLPRLFALLALCLVTACGATGYRVSGPVCLPFAPLGVGAPAEQDSLGGFAPTISAVIEAAPEIPVTEEMSGTIEDALRGPSAEAILENRSFGKKHILAISVGGQNGAFSSGFLTGWTETGTRPVFDIVTGGSAGAIVAPVAFAGSEFDGELRQNTGISEDDVFERRGPLGALLSTSLSNTGPLERMPRRFYDGDAIFEALTEQTADNRLLLIGATELNSGKFRRFDLAQLLQSDEDDDVKRACLTKSVLASSAIPGLFPPRLINGALYSDAGVRRSIFLDQIIETLDKTRGRPRAEVYLLINGALEFSESEIDPSLIDLVGRNFEIVSDEIMRASILRVLDGARFRGYNLRAAAIKETPSCGSDSAGSLTEGLFSACVTDALFQQGYELARSDDPWMTAAELERALEAGRVDQ